ncbi:hypothetical protein EVAR_5351_1 [Eumeta japonica]|uniref:Uncharacterized protein n=1 Tax=Eumeta variegata TaxID=151549 RepID=A0A4C1TNX8_EUMVA|nr:hypothetical protein EVAR_5351_1 [Eumeta japonica]
MNIPVARESRLSPQFVDISDPKIKSNQKYLYFIASVNTSIKGNFAFSRFIFGKTASRRVRSSHKAALRPKSVVPIPFFEELRSGIFQIDKAEDKQVPCSENVVGINQERCRDENQNKFYVHEGEVVSGMEPSVGEFDSHLFRFFLITPLPQLHSPIIFLIPIEGFGAKGLPAGSVRAGPSTGSSPLRRHCPGLTS